MSQPTPASPDPAPTPVRPPSAATGGGKKGVGEGPILPVGLLLVGLYLTWFGVHYWRSDVKWPSDPLKAVLTGKPIPDATNTSDKSTSDTFGRMLIAGEAPAEGGSRPGETPIGAGQESKISADAMQYIGAGYHFGGPADRVGNWDCSSFVSYVLGHDLGIPLPGGVWGAPGFPPHAHGPTTQNYLLYGIAINRDELSPGDLVVWPTHMGIAINRDQIVAARSTATGTGLSNIDGTTQSLGEGSPHLRRVPLRDTPTDNPPRGG